MNIDWTAIPLEYNWAAMDANGSWWAYVAKPEQIDINGLGNKPNGWGADVPSGGLTACPITPKTDDPFLLEVYSLIWADSLVQKPSTNSPQRTAV